MVCAVIVGRLGMHQLGAVGLSNMVFFFVTVFFSFLLVVTTPRVADALALNNRREVCRAACINLDMFTFGSDRYATAFSATWTPKI